MHSNDNISVEEVAFGGYAEEVLSDITEVRSIEVHGVVEFGGTDGRLCCEVNDAEPETYSVYARLFDGSVTCIGDYPNPGEANEYAEDFGRRYKLPVEYFQLAVAA